LVTSDWHIPYHDPRGIAKVLEAQELLGIRNLCIAGDFLHVDAISTFTQRSKQPTLGEEIVQAKLILDALTTRFDRIEILPGNHDHRVEKTLARMATSVEGAQGLQMIGALVGLSEFTPADVALSFFEHFFDSDKVTVHSLSDMVINDTWVIQHPGSARKAPASSEREFCTIYRKSVLQGHSHLFALAFDPSGQDIAFNIGRMSDDSKFRYKRERPKPFPKGTLGMAAILTSADDSAGRLLPLAVHDRWFDLGLLKERLAS
jgi:predicted phosphodiesterase